MKISPIFLLFALLISSCSHIQPRVNLPEHNSIERTLASDECDELIAKFFKRNLPTLEVPENSFLIKNPEFINRMDSIRLSSIDYSLFYQDFIALNNRAPTLRDALTYIQGIKLKTIENYDLLIAELKKLPAKNSFEVELFTNEAMRARNKVSKLKSIDQYNEELIASYENGKNSIPHIDTVITADKAMGSFIDEEFFQYLKVADTLSAFQGEYGELMAMATSKEKVVMRGMRFNGDGFNNPPVENQIAKQVAELEKRVIKMTDKEILNFIYPHREGLFREAYRFLEENNFSMSEREIVIGKIFNMIRSKEIDLVTEDGQGKITWGEVKAYNKPVTMNLITHGHKSILEQLIEHKALRDVLGLENSVKLRFVSSISIIDEEAEAAIKNIGYEVISAK